MKRILFFSAAFLLSATMIFAQGRQRGERNPKEMIEKRVERMTEDLSLSANQVSEIKSAWLANHEAREAELEQTGNREARKAIAKKYREANKEKMKAILTEEQLTKLKALQAERKEKMKACRKSMRGERGHHDGGF